MGRFSAGLLWAEQSPALFRDGALLRPFLSEGERLAVQLGGGQLFAAVDELE